MQKNPTRFLKVLMAFAFSVFGLCQSVAATDFFLRPTNLSMIDGWTSQLSFFVSNPSERTIVLKIETRHAGTVLASNQPEEIALKALPAEIVLKAGARKIIRLDYTANQYRKSNHYEVVVEQLPIIYLKPGEGTLPQTMLVTRYVAEVEVRPREAQKQYAMTGFGRDYAKELPIPAGAQD